MYLQADGQQGRVDLGKPCDRSGISNQEGLSYEGWRFDIRMDTP